MFDYHKAITVAILVGLGLAALIIFITISLHGLITSREDKNKPVSQHPKIKKNEVLITEKNYSLDNFQDLLKNNSIF
jgi:large-conductance mechanosensitive channel